MMYEEKPLSILVLPPINRTTAADAKDYYATTIAAPLALRGFYVLPIEVTSEILKSQGIYDTETIQRQPVAKFKQYFGADAVLYTEITRWSTSYAVVAANLTVGFHATLKSTITENILWDYSGTIVVDLTGRSNSGNLIADLIVGAVATSIAAAAADYVPYASLVNTQILTTIPVGKYHDEYLTDQGFTFVDQGALPTPQHQSVVPAPVKNTEAALPANSIATTPSAPAAVLETQVERPKFQNHLGLEVSVAGGQIIVTDVKPESAAAQAGIKRDDQILKYNGVPDGSGDSAMLQTIASAINKPLLNSASITWRSGSSSEKTQTLAW